MKLANRLLVACVILLPVLFGNLIVFLVSGYPLPFLVVFAAECVMSFTATAIYVASMIMEEISDKD